MNYIEKFDASPYEIKYRDGEKVSKVRAKVIIGCDGDDGQRQALHRLNGHLHRLEVLTFDQLLRIAERVAGCLEQDAQIATSATASL